MKDSEILTAAKELIEDPEHWCRGHGHLLVNDVEKWCAVGALAWVIGGGTTVFLSEKPEQEVIRLRLFLNGFSSEVTGRPMGIMSLNDCFGHEPVIQAYEKAIAAKQEVGE